MKETIRLGLIAVALGSVLAGCDNIGNAPPGQSADQAKAAFEQKSPEEQIALINTSPAPAEEKARRIKEIKQKAGMPLDDAPTTTPPGAPPGMGGGPNSGTYPGDPRGGN